jgi:hypothetical protein
VDRVVGLDGVRNDVAMMQTPDGHGRLELMKFHTPLPPLSRTHRRTRWVYVASCSPLRTSRASSPACRPTAVDVGLQLGDLLLGGCDRVGAGDKPPSRRLLVGDPQEHLGELGRGARLPAVLGGPPLDLGSSAPGVVVDSGLSEVRGLGRQQLGPEEEIVMAWPERCPTQLRGLEHNHSPPRTGLLGCERHPVTLERHCE